MGALYIASSVPMDEVNCLIISSVRELHLHLLFSSYCGRSKKPFLPSGSTHYTLRAGEEVHVTFKSQKGVDFSLKFWP